MKTRSTEEAMDVMETHRSELIARAREVATELARKHGTVTSRHVRRNMKELGLLDETTPDYWLGAVFRGKAWEWTGERVTYSDASRNIHERTIKVWRLRYGIR